MKDAIALDSSHVTKILLTESVFCAIKLRLGRDEQLQKIRVLFPYVEAGYGHIMPMKSILDSFTKKYGDKVEVVSVRFYADSGDSHLVKYEQMISRQVRLYNKVPFIGHLGTFADEFFGAYLSSFGALRIITPFAYSHGVKHMRELAPDVVISTHWATNYYAKHLKKDEMPLTIMYCPDAQLNKLFEYPSDLNLISAPYGYLRALRKRKYNMDNMKMVPFFIRNEAFSVSTDKKALREKLGLPVDKLTIVLAEGGYGIGKIEPITKLLIKEHIPLTVISICGTNKKLHEKMLGFECTDEVTFKPMGFADNILELEAASDIFCGKAGNILGESTFFGNPSIVTHCANMIEHNICDHYMNTVGCTIKEYSPKKVVKIVKNFVNNPELLEPYRKRALAYHENFGSEAAADVIFEKIAEVYPDLKK